MELTWIGMDGLKPVFCSAEDWSQQSELLAAEKQAGEWKKVLCPAGSFVQGAQVRFQDDQGTFCDDSAIQGLQLTCKNPYDNNKATVVVTNGVIGTWRTLKTNYQFVQAVQARYEVKKVGDNSALNGIKF